MGNQPSSQVGEAGNGDSRSSSPLPGEDGDDGYDGLPRLDSSAAGDFRIDYSQAVDGIPTFSQPAEPARKDKAPRSANSRRSSDINVHEEDDTAGPGNNDAATDELEAVARNLKSEPESPEITKSKKKKRRRSRAQVLEQSEDPHIHAPGSREVDDGLPTVAEAPEVLSPPEEAIALPAPEAQDGAPARSPELAALQKKKKKRKKKAKAGAANEPSLDLNEDPIAGSDEEVVIPSSGRPSRSRKPDHDDGGSSRKFKKRTSTLAVSGGDALAIEDVADEELRADVVTSTQNAVVSEARVPDGADVVPAPIDFLRRSREPEPYDIGEDKISPSVTRQERRANLASSRIASASLAEMIPIEQPPVSLTNGMSEHHLDNVGETDADAMDVDTFDPQLNGSVDRAASEDASGSASGYAGDLPGYDDQDQAMEDDAHLPTPSQHNHEGRPVSEAVDIMSSLEDDALITLASTQPQPATDDKRSRSDRSDAEDNEQQETIKGDAGDSQSHSAASNGKVTRGSRQRQAQARAAANEPRMALQSMLDSSKDGAEAGPSEALPEPEAESQDGVGPGPGSTRQSVNNLLADGSLAVNTNNHEAEATMAQTNGNMAAPNDESRTTGHLPATQTPRGERSSAHTTPRSSRTYSRQPKPSFYERSAEDTAQAFAELPSNEVAATPRATKSKAKRRLPVDVPDAESAPSKRQRSSLLGPPKSSNAPKTPKDADAPNNTPGRRKAPETATRNSTGYLTGVFTKTEVSQVEGAVEAFRQDHGLEQHELNAMIQQNPKDPSIKDNSLHEELWSRVLDACPTRPRQKLLNWCRQKFHNFVARATWTPEQDEELRQMVRQHGTRWNVIGQLINRHQKDVRDRWRNYLVAGSSQKKHQWSQEEEKEFLEIVGEVLSIFRKERERDPNNDMFKSGRTDEELVDWNVVAERMKHTRSRLQCQEKWRRMRESSKINATILAGQLEPDQRWRLRRARMEVASLSHADMYHIVLAIRNMDGGAKDDASINWKAVLDSQRKKYHRYTGMLLWHRLRQLVPDHETKNVQDCAKELITMYQSDGGTFSIPGDEAFDDAEEEQLLADIPAPRKRGLGKTKPGKGKVEGRDAGRRRIVSEPFVYDSDSEDGEQADDGDSSRANYNETSPAPELGEQSQNGGTRDADEASLDLADDAGHDARGSSVDLSIVPAANGEQVDNLDPELEPDETNLKSTKKGKSKAQHQDEEGPSGVKKHRKRYSGEMMPDASPQKRPTESSSRRRKRARADEVGTPDASTDPAHKKKKAKRGSNVTPVEQQAAVVEGTASSDDDMEDIPARLPRTA